MTDKGFAISLSNQRLLELSKKRQLDFKLNPELLYPWWRRCHVRVLMVTDGGLDFGTGDFGLSALVDILKNDAPSRVKFDISLAHLRSDASNAQIQAGATGIVRSMKGFRFDNPAQFKAADYDEVWLFGAETNFWTGSYADRNANHATYPQTQLATAELNILFDFMNTHKGGVFATGDHGALGKGLCSGIPRVRSMRYWDHYPSANEAVSQVGMSGPWRNDTNHAGHDAGAQFSDQSDDIPQTIDLKLYSTRVGILKRARYPHPLLCGQMGRINVLPDHPHEGECRVPDSLTLTFNGSDEYPAASGGGARIAPEIVAHARVPAGNTADKAGSKQPTIAHSFGIIAAYDGHRADVGRVSTDATWHHFINVNLIGVVEGGIFDQFDAFGGDQHIGEDASKHNGFLSSASGMAALDKIKNYFTNIGVWLAPPALHTCFNKFVWWQVAYVDRVMEAALIDPNVAFEKIQVDTFYAIGVHARDAFGRRASQCQSLQWVIDWIKPLIPEFVPWIDPWDPVIHVDTKGQPPVPVIDPVPILDVALGAALVALRQAQPYPPEKLTKEHDSLVERAITVGAQHGLKLAVSQFNASVKSLDRVLGHTSKG